MLAMAEYTLVAADSDSSCPHCTSDQVHRNGWYSLKNGRRQQRWLCGACGRSFSPNTGTSKAYVKKQNEFDQFVETMDEGLSLREQADDLDVHPSTTFRWRHRILSMFAGLAKPKLSGQVTIVETHVAHSRKGQRTKPARFRRFTDGRPSRVLFFTADSGHCSVIVGSGKLNAEALRPCMEERLAPEAQVCTIGSPTFAAACQNTGRVCRDGTDLQPDEANGLRPLFQAVHRMRAGFHGWMVRFRGVASRHLHHYLAWYDSLIETTYALT